MLAYSGSNTPVGGTQARAYNGVGSYATRSATQGANVTRFSTMNGELSSDSARSNDVRNNDELGRRNRALREVPARDWARFSARLERSVLVPDQTLHEVGAPVERVYFPNSGLISLLVDGHADELVEVALCGREGVAGALEAVNQEPATMRALVQAPGTAIWMSAADFREEWSRGGPLQAWLLRYFSFVNVQTSQCALCNRMHTVEERLARWLLQVSERLETNDVSITHEFISHMLGTRRSGVTIGLGVLQKAQLLDLSRGRIAITDKTGLEATACVCHRTLKSGYDALWQPTNKA